MGRCKEHARVCVILYPTRASGSVVRVLNSAAASPVRSTLDAALSRRGAIDSAAAAVTDAAADDALALPPDGNLMG